MAKLGRTRTWTPRPAHHAADDHGLIPFPREEADPRELAEAFDRYRAAVAAALPGATSSVQLAEARMNLTRLLVRDGWEPPASVMDQLGKDEEFLRRPLSSVS